MLGEDHYQAGISRQELFPSRTFSAIFIGDFNMLREFNALCYSYYSPSPLAFALVVSESSSFTMHMISHISQIDRKRVPLQNP